MKVLHQSRVWIVLATSSSVTNGQLEYLIASNDKIKVALASRCKPLKEERYVEN